MPGGFAHVLDDHWFPPPTGDQKQWDSVVRMNGLRALQTREVTQLLSPLMESWVDCTRGWLDV